MNISLIQIYLGPVAWTDYQKLVEYLTMWRPCFPCIPRCHHLILKDVTSSVCESEISSNCVYLYCCQSMLQRNILVQVFITIICKTKVDLSLWKFVLLYFWVECHLKIVWKDKEQILTCILPLSLVTMKIYVKKSNCCDMQILF